MCGECQKFTAFVQNKPELRTFGQRRLAASIVCSLILTVKVCVKSGEVDRVKLYITDALTTKQFDALQNCSLGKRTQFGTRCFH